jgi:membrane-bound hydrogenase subunit alpha
MTRKTIIPIGPYHPLQEEPELFKLYCDGEIVKDIKWETGYNHRGIEKLSETKSYDQVFFLVEGFVASVPLRTRLPLPMQ